jgi:putative NADH-flavin reductase
MKVLVLGANGSTGFNVVTQLLNHGINVRALTRNMQKFEPIKRDDHLEVESASILEIESQKLKQYLTDVDAVISCLGHNISIKGILGKPHTLVVDAITRIVTSINEIGSDRVKKIILLNTTACINTEQNETYTKGEKVVMKIMRALLPPQKDNDRALEYLISKVGINNKFIEWIAVRPDTLINENEITEYTVYPSTVRSPIFDAGKTSRINVADFMVKVLGDKELWEKWRFKTPVVYNKGFGEKTQA